MFPLRKPSKGLNLIFIEALSYITCFAKSTKILITLFKKKKKKEVILYNHNIYVVDLDFKILLFVLYNLLQWILMPKSLK